MALCNMRAGFRVSNGWCTGGVLGHIINLDVRAVGLGFVLNMRGKLSNI